MIFRIETKIDASLLFKFKFSFASLLVNFSSWMEWINIDETICDYYVLRDIDRVDKY